MKKIILLFIAIVCMTDNAMAQKKYNSVNVDSTEIKYFHRTNLSDAYIFEENKNSKKIIYVNEQVTTHIIMPETIKLVDISTKRVVGNQCEDNIVRIKPCEKMYNNELAGTITVIGERHIVQYNIVYTNGPSKANSIYNVNLSDMENYNNPDVSMSEGDMARYAWRMFCSKNKFWNIHTTQNGIKAKINNIYTVNDYIFIDFSLQNKSKIKYDIDEIKIKLMDKKEGKATNFQTTELSPVWTLNNTTRFGKGYRNIIVINKLTFPDEKILKLEIAESQISGRTVEIPIEYSDILNADSFDDSFNN